ncbi:MAG: marine proteobacterial sortase target protein [Polyangiaceae bacterium]|nr:marine proteobacterial sortase target protein [Polyangiaceae bacterium]
MLNNKASSAGEESVTNTVLHGGRLQMQLPSGQKLSAPTLELSYRVEVAGLLARTTLTQSFQNTSTEVVEAVYSFPLPAEGKVDGMLIKVGERRIVGQVKERQLAQQTYEAAKSAGKRAALIHQEQANLFSTHVSPILPGEHVEVEISIQQTISYEAGTFSLSLPSTLTPRYLPGSDEMPPLNVHGFGRGTVETSGKFAQPPPKDRSLLQPPSLTHRKGPLLSVEINLAQGMPLERIHSPSHSIQQRSTSKGTQVRLKANQALADRDFLLNWSPPIHDAPTAAIFYEERAGKTYAQIMLLPSATDQQAAIPREVTFIIDESGSMSGTSLVQAKSALATGLRLLQNKDTFNIIAFDDELRRLWATPQALTSETKQQGEQFVDSIAADGGTEMAPALRAAFSPTVDQQRVSQVLFLTDGAIGNERDLLELIHRELGARSLFPIAIGSAPNQGFMREAARMGRGSFTLIANHQEVGTRMRALQEQLVAPVLRNLQLKAKAAKVYPARLPELYRGQPLIINLEFDASLKEVQARPPLKLTGQRLGQTWSSELPLKGGKVQAGVAKAWASAAIEQLLDQRSFGAPEAKIKTEVLPLALKFGLVTPYTSFVAVDQTPLPHHERPTPQLVAQNLPAGSQLLGNLPSTATPAPLLLILSLLSVVAGVFFHRRSIAR